MSILTFYHCNIKKTQAELSCHLFQDGSACVYNSLTITDLFNYILTIVYRPTNYINSLHTNDPICQPYIIIVNSLLTVPDTFYPAIKIQKVSKKGIINVEAKSFSDANVITHMEVKKRDKKKDYKETISQMSDKGYSNNDISYLLDISPSYVSKLKK